jgi:hypothetical protein
VAGVCEEKTRGTILLSWVRDAYCPNKYFLNSMWESRAFENIDKQKHERVTFDTVRQIKLSSWGVPHMPQ